MTKRFVHGLSCAALALSLVFGIVFAVRAETPAPSAQVGVVAQRYPWNGMVDVACKVANAPDDASLVVIATPASATVGGDPRAPREPIEVARVIATNGEQKVSFDANKIPALKGRALKDVKVSAKVEAK